MPEGWEKGKLFFGSGLNIIILESISSQNSGNTILVKG